MFRVVVLVNDCIITDAFQESSSPYERFALVSLYYVRVPVLPDCSNCRLNCPVLGDMVLYQYTLAWLELFEFRGISVAQLVLPCVGGISGGYVLISPICYG